MRTPLALALALAACTSPHHLNDFDAAPGSGADGATGGPDAAPGTITPTAVGTPSGAPVTATIDPDGTNLTSSDGVLELDFPAGAFATPTDVTITPISDEAPLGLPTAWRIEPAGTTLGAPAQVILHLPADVAHRDDTGSLFLASQDAQGYWNAGAAASWDEGNLRATASSPTTLGDWALTSCVSLVSDEDLVLQGVAHLRVVRQCAAAPSSGRVGGGVDTADPVAWSDAALGGGADLGTLTPSGATATLAPPTQPPQSGIPVTVVTATVSSSAFAPSFAPHNLVVDHHVAIASYAQWTLEGKTFSAVLGSSVLSHAGASNLALSDMVDSASLTVGFPGDHPGGFAATGVNAEVAGGAGGDLRYVDHYTIPCTTTLKTLTSSVSVTSANKNTYQMYGSFEGTLAIQRGTKQCPTGPETDYVEVPLTGAFRLMWNNI
jgi:hypothetical protein